MASRQGDADWKQEITIGGIWGGTRGDGEAMGTNGNAPMAQPRLSKGGPGLGGKLNGKTTIPQLWDNSGLGEKDLNWVGEPGGELNAGGEGPSGGGPGSSRGDTPESHREAAIAALETFGGGVLAGQGVGAGKHQSGRTARSEGHALQRVYDPLLVRRVL